VKHQSLHGSLIETLSNTLIGYVITLAVQIVVFPWFGIFVPISTNILLGFVFVFISIIRGYVVRRVFERLRINGWFA
jgi:hypothetical protein